MICILLLMIELGYATNNWRTAVYFEPTKNVTLQNQATVRDYWRLHVCVCSSRGKYEPYNSTHVKLLTYYDSDCQISKSYSYREGVYYDEIEVNAAITKAYYIREVYSKIRCLGDLYLIRVYNEQHCNEMIRTNTTTNQLMLVTYYMDYSSKYIYTNWEPEPTAEELCQNENKGLLNAVSQKIGECYWDLGGSTTDSWIFRVNKKNFPEYTECDSASYITMVIVLFLCVLVF